MNKEDKIYVAGHRGMVGSAIYASEGGILWTVPSGGVPTNTMVTFTGGGAGGFTTFPSGNLEAGVTVSSGTIAASGIAASMALTTNGTITACERSNCPVIGGTGIQYNAVGFGCAQTNIVVAGIGIRSLCFYRDVTCQ